MKYGIILASLLLASCGFTPQGDLVRSVVREKGAQAYDEGLANSLWFMCNTASVGSIRRTFGKQMDAYNALCSEAVLRLD
jgi:hypothetical protein